MKIKTKIKTKIRFEKTNICICLVSSFGIALAYFVSNKFFKLDIISIYWALIIAFLAPLSSYIGRNKVKMLKRNLHQAIYIAITMLVITFISRLHFISYWFFVFGFVFYIFLLYFIEHINKVFNGFSAFLTVYALVAQHLIYSSRIDLSDIIYSQFLGILIGSLSFCIIASIVPYKTNITPEKIAFNKVYALKRGAKVASAFFILFFINYFFNVYNLMWSGISIVVVMQGVLGKSFEMAIKRVVGTILGVIIGVIISYLMPDIDVFYFILLFLFLTIGNYLVFSHYSIALCSYTIMLSTLFYFVHANDVALSNYLFSRLLDTCLGVCLALFCESVVFPNSFIENYKRHLYLCYESVSKFLSLFDLSKNISKESVVEYDFLENIVKLECAANNIKYEPVMLFSKKRKLCFKLPNILRKIVYLLNNIHKYNLSNKFNAYEIKILKNISKSFFNLNDLRNTKNIDKLEALNNIEKLLSKKDLKKTAVNSKAILELHIQVVKLIKRYKELY